MRRFVTFSALVFLFWAMIPVTLFAQSLPTLTLNGLEGNVTVLAGTVINMNTPTGDGIYEYGTADCSGGVAFVHPSTHAVAKATATSVGFAPFQAGNVGTCRVGTWTAAPTFTLNGVADNLSVEAGQPITFAATPADFPLVAYPGEFCTGTPITTFPSGTTQTETVATTYYVLAQWPDLERRACRTATWTAAPPPTEPPPLTIDGVAANATFTVGETATIETAADASILFFSTADCTGPSSTIPGSVITSMLGIPGSMSYLAFWNAHPDVRSGCLVATWEAAPPTEVPPITINGEATNATLTVGDTAAFATDPAASISFYLSADCGGAVSSTWSPGFTSTPIEPVTYSARAYWTAFPDIQGDCLNATWSAFPSPTVTATVSPTAEPSATATTGVTAVPTSAGPGTGSQVVTSLPETGAGASSTDIYIVVSLLGLAALLALARIRRPAPR